MGVLTGERPRFDWRRLKTRLRDGNLQLDPAGIRPALLEARYRERAVRLAARQAPSASSPAASPVLVFCLSRERYALELEHLAEVLPFAGCALMPEPPRGLLGFINLRGDLRPLVDLRSLLDPSAEERDPTAAGYILALNEKLRRVTLLVDRVDEIQFLAREALVAATQASRQWPSRFLKALSPDSVIILSPEALLTQPLFQGFHTP